MYENEPCANVKGVTRLCVICVKYVMIQVVNWMMRFTVMAQRFQQMAATAGKLYRMIWDILKIIIYDHLLKSERKKVLFFYGVVYLSCCKKESVDEILKCDHSNESY